MTVLKIDGIDYVPQPAALVWISPDTGNVVITGTGHTIAARVCGQVDRGIIEQNRRREAEAGQPV